MRNKLIILIFTAITINNINLAQPDATVQFFGGYSFPLGDLKGNFGSTFSTWTVNNPDTNTYYMKNGISYGIAVKVPVVKKSKFNIIGSLGFSTFSNSATYDDEGGAGTFSLSQSQFFITLGGEYSFFRKKAKLIPFIGAEAMLNLFSGRLVAEEDETTEYNMNSATRLGIIFGGGFDYVIHNNLGLCLAAKYAMANLIGKNYKSDLGKKYNLGDGEHTIDGVYYPAKSINYLTIYGGLSFYFGR